MRGVKAFKWWKKNFVTGVDSIKSYSFESFIGEVCPNLGEKSLAECVMHTFYNISRYASKPFIPDRGIPTNNVFSRVADADFMRLVAAATKEYTKAKAAFDEPKQYESSVIWRDIFGTEFPLYEKHTPQFTKREAVSTPTVPNRYA